MASPNTANSRARSGKASSGSRLTWAGLLASLLTDETRQLVVGAYRQAGFTPDDFGSYAARVAAVSALSRAEDACEVKSGGRMTAERLALRTYRRLLEDEVSA
jgi:hypothetical protein